MVGSYFSNIHIRKKDHITLDGVAASLNTMLAQRGYIPAATAAEADAAVAIFTTPDSGWITLCSDLLSHDDPDSCAAILTPLSQDLDTDALGIACFDSDFLYLNLVHSGENCNAWIGIGPGKEMGIPRRSGLTPWKKKVANYAAFSAASREKFVCADAFLQTAAPCLQLPLQHSTMASRYLHELDSAVQVTYLHYLHPLPQRTSGPHLEICYWRYNYPCFAEMENHVTMMNYGDAAYGLSIYFMGPYVEREDITFSQVRISRFCRPETQIQLKKVQLPDGQWAYCWQDPEFVLPPGPPKRITERKLSDWIREQSYTLRFVPHGDPKQMLDVTVVMVPDGNRENQAIWNIWQPHGSKQAFIAHHNQLWKRLRAFHEDPAECLPLLKEPDFVE